MSKIGKQSAEAMNDLLALSIVPRWAIVPMSRPQSVGEHSFRVAVILLELCKRLGIKADHDALVWALTHDGPESRTGDIPSTVPRNLLTETELAACPWYRDIIGHIPVRWRMMVKLADLIEAATYVAMWGNGAHARKVAALAKDRAIAVSHEFAAHPDFGYPEVPGHVAFLMEDIESEIGR